MKAPINPTIVTTNPMLNKNEIMFAPELVEFIRQGKKLKTYRFGTKYNYLKPGDIVDLTVYGTGEKISSAKITTIEQVIFKDIPLNLDEHEYYENKEHQRKVFSSYYKYLGREIADDDQFMIISYQLLS